MKTKRCIIFYSYLEAKMVKVLALRTKATILIMEEREESAKVKDGAKASVRGTPPTVGHGENEWFLRRCDKN